MNGYRNVAFILEISTLLLNRGTSQGVYSCECLDGSTAVHNGKIACRDRKVVTEIDRQSDRRAAATELLVLRAQRQDRTAWKALVEQWDQRLFAYVRTFTESEPDTCDVLQSVWLSALSKINTLRNADRFPAWIYRIARNAALKHLRKRGRRLETSLTECGDLPAVPDATKFADAEAVYSAMSQLSLAHREALTLFFLEDLSTAEVAELIKVSVGTVKSRLHYARQELRRKLEQSDHE